MTVSLTLKSEKLEPVYGWLESNGGAKVQLWGWETGRRVALLAYSDGGEDGFGWSNWLANTGGDPSVLTPLFDQLELVVEGDVATKLNATFLGTFTVVPNTAFG